VTNPEALRTVLIDAAREFNAGRYFEAHEILEEGLEVVPEHLWELFLGLIRIAVGYHKVSQELWDGAATLLRRGLETVAPFPPEAAGLNLEGLRQRVSADVEQLRRGRFDAAAFARHPPRLQPLA
jgi:predicted metal-dependent hydrolase